MAEDITDPIIQHSADELLAYGIGDIRQAVSVGGRQVYLQSVSISEEGDVKTYKDNIGQTVALIIPEQYQQLQCDGLLVKNAGAEPPRKGDEVKDLDKLGIEGLKTGGNIKFRLESFSVSWSNEDVAKVSMTVRSYQF